MPYSCGSSSDSKTMCLAAPMKYVNFTVCRVRDEWILTFTMVNIVFIIMRGMTTMTSLKDAQQIFIMISLNNKKRSVTEFFTLKQHMLGRLWKCVCEHSTPHSFKSSFQVQGLPVRGFVLLWRSNLDILYWFNLMFYTVDVFEPRLHCICIYHWQLHYWWTDHNTHCKWFLLFKFTRWGSL